MTVDDRFLDRWRQAQRARAEARQPASRNRHSSLSLMARTFEAPDRVDETYRGLWQQARIERWLNDDEDLSHEAYLAWWRAHGGESEDYTEAHHFQHTLRLMDDPRALPGRSIVEVFDLLWSRWKGPLAAEAFRRWLAARAER